ncbi:MAG: hypothetical protein NVSMB52_04590 [Chloroflexota bacterium]
MARWAKAAHALRLPQGARVLDLGCAFGFGTRMLTARFATFGHDLSKDYIERAKRSVPNAIFTQGPAHKIPYPDGYFDAVLLLDVLEHVPDELQVLDEISRVLRVGGQLVLSVPNKGWLATMDSLNVYHRLFGLEAPPPTDDPSWPHSPVHRHYSLSDMEKMLGHRFHIKSVRYSGIGVAEPINVLLLIAFRRLLRLPRVYSVLQYIYFGVYLAEDKISTGSYGYHMMIDAEHV